MHPGGRDGVFGGQVGTLEQRRDDVTEEEKDQSDRAENGEAADKDVPAGQAIFQRTNTALALQLRRIEVNSLGGFVVMVELARSFIRTP
ncbi:hypothetical protein LLY42_05375 [Pseudomonas frederiksbergensis]|nr:hypothetical protein LLY42_05375 [Pseudomonas frederiksbergensis]